MILALMGQVAERVRSGEVGRDALNSPIVGELSRESYPCRLEQGTTDEPNEAFVVDAWRGMFPIDADIGPDDTVEESRRLFTVEGSPERRSIPGFPATDHLAVPLKYVGPVAR